MALTGSYLINKVKTDFEISLSPAVTRAYGNLLQAVIDANPTATNLDTLLANALIKQSLIRKVLLDAFDSNSNGKFDTLAELTVVRDALKTTVNDAKTDVANGGGTVTTGQTFMLTKGLDNVPGTSGNDTIIGSIDNSGTPNVELNTLSTLDIVNGGAGVDTLSINVTGGPAVVLPNMTNVEIVKVESTVGATVDTSTIAGVTNLNVTKAAGAVSATAAATTDVSVDVKAAGAATSAIGGNNVTVKVADVAATTNTIAVGAGTAPKGDVVVEAAAKAAVNGTSFTMGTIAVTGGKTVSVTQKAGDASGLVAGDTATTHTQGAVTVTANSETTTVTVKQDAAAAPASTKAVAKVDEVATVTFTKLDSGQSATVSGLTFTASKDLTAEQVAKAFANLSATAPTPTQIAGTPATATGDTNGGDARADGVFTGALLAKWSSAAASGNTVTFTASGAMGTDLAASGTGATAVTNTQGVDAVTGKNTLGVTNGVVAITGGAALKTVTVDGYATSATKGTNGIIGTTNTVLDTINLANGTGFVIESAAAALALDLKNVNGTVDVDAGTKTLNVSVSHAKATDTATIAANEATSVKVTGTGNVAGTTGAGANQLDAATSIDTTGMTAGKATFTVADGTVTSYAGGAGVDSVTITNGGTAITKAFDLGAGDDTLKLDGTVVVPTATLKGGDGTDTIGMTGASAESLSANSTFAGKIEGFEKLSITDKVAAATTINMANMDGITYVVSGNSTAVTSAAVDENCLLTFQGLSAGQSVTVAGCTVTVSAGVSATATEIAAAFLSGNPTTTNAGAVPNTLTVSGALTGWTAAASAAGVLKFTSTTPATNVGTDLAATDAGLAAPAVAIAAGTFTDGNGTTTAAKTDWTTQGLTNGQSFTIANVTVTALKSLSAAEVAQAFAGTLAAAGNYSVSGTATAATWTTPTFSASGTTLTLTNTGFASVTGYTTGSAGNAPGLSPTDAVVSSYVQGAAAGAGAATAALTIDKMANNGTLELVAAGDGAVVKMADATGSTDSFNIVTKVVGTDLNFGELDVAGVETLKLNAIDTTVPPTAGAAVNTATLDIKADKATSLTIEGNSNVTLTLDATTTKLATIDAGTLTGNLIAGNSHAGVNTIAMTITGGKGADQLKASVGTNAKADVLNGGDGNDTLYAGSNGAKLSGGDGNDLFIVTANSATVGNKESNTYSEILDFKAGDLLQLQASNTAGGAAIDVTAFTKLAASLNESTAVFSDFVNAAIKEAGAGAATWFNYKGDAYVVIDSATDSTGDVFKNGEDLIVKLTGINGDNLSWNSDYATVALI